MNGKHYAKKAYKDIKLKSGLTIPKGASLMVTPIIGSDRSCKAVYNGVEYKLSYGSVFKPPAEKTLEKWVCSEGCNTPTGEWVEPDGEDEYGFPSWLRALGFI